jgi:hypothetical protein
MSRYEKFSLDNDVIQDAHKVICDENLELSGLFGDFGILGNISTFGDMSTGRI